MTTHSDKALQTLTAMGTAPSAWTLTPIEWVEEERDVIGDVRCPECNGTRWVCYDADGNMIPRPVVPPGAGYFSPEAQDEREYDRRARAAVGNGYNGSCRRCRNRRDCSTGKVRGKVRARVMVGYPQFPAGTVFDSRFRGGLVCHLCNKTILKSGRVPVHATGSDGKVHGMFVGEDCARKFLTVKIKRSADSIMEDAQ